MATNTIQYKAAPKTIQQWPIQYKAATNTIQYKAAPKTIQPWPIQYKAATNTIQYKGHRRQSNSGDPVQSGKDAVQSGSNEQVQSGHENSILAGKKSNSSGLLRSYLAADEDTDTQPVAKKAKKGRTTKNSQKAGIIEDIEARRSRPENLKGT